jgi:hypothetical protein
MRQKPTLTSLDLCDKDILRKLSYVKTKGDLQDYVSADFSLSREPSLLRVTKEAQK